MRSTTGKPIQFGYALRKEIVVAVQQTLVFLRCAEREQGADGGNRRGKHVQEDDVLGGRAANGLDVTCEPLRLVDIEFHRCQHRPGGTFERGLRARLQQTRCRSAIATVERLQNRANFVGGVAEIAEEPPLLLTGPQRFGHPDLPLCEHVESA
jgi:hypothetical protein